MAIVVQHAGTHAAPKRRAPRKGRFAKGLSGLVPTLRKPVKPAELIFFSSQLSLMLEVGTPVSEALRALARQTDNPGFTRALKAMMVDIEEGRQLSQAMQRHPRIFTHVFTSMIKAGETGGFLKTILDRIVRIQKRRLALVTQIRSALTYPAVLCVTAIAVVVFVLVGVLPKFTAVFAGKEALLPFSTRLLLLLSVSMKSYWWAYLISFAGLLAGFRWWMCSEQAREVIDRLQVRAPFVARLSNKIYTCEMLRILGHLMESKVPLMEALEVTWASVRNRHFKQFIQRIMSHVQQGGRFSQPFADVPYLLESVKQMVATGEEVGNLPIVMLRLAEFYDDEVDRELKTFASLLEPMALIFLGAAVALIVSSVILPMFRMAGAVQ